MGPPGGNLYTDSALKAASYDQVWAVYAAGLGLVRLKTTIFESGIHFELKGYVRNGITYGLVESDSAFEEPVALRIASPAKRASSDMLRFTSAGPVFRTLGAPIFRDLRGRVR